MPVDVKSNRIPMRLPHEASATLLVTYPEVRVADSIEEEIRNILNQSPFRWRLQMVSDRPPMEPTKKNANLAKSIRVMAEEWGISLRTLTSAMPSVAGLVPRTTEVVCGLGPVTNDPYTFHESIGRSSLLKRTLLLAQFLLSLYGK
jgi:acetylornithine deacetylase/succinyl-diaminopimelate desuccinylase-like protein